MRRLVKTVAVFEAFCLALFFINLWFLAFLNGGELSIRIDSYSEMWLEYALWLILTPLLVLGAHYTIEEL